MAFQVASEVLHGLVQRVALAPAALVCFGDELSALRPKRVGILVELLARLLEYLEGRDRVTGRPEWIGLAAA